MKLNLSPDLSLPLDAVTQKFAFLGRTGSGKTYAATKLAEEMHAAGAQIVVLDPVGVWYGLRLAANGKDAGISIPVFGGLHGDVPLEATGGALAANIVADTGGSFILDVSQFESDADKARFARAFAERFFFRKKGSPSAVHLFLEECQEFIPQNPGREEAMMLHAFTRLTKLGRNFGIGASLISQRPQEVDKKALNMTECLFAFQMTGIHERKTVKAWIHDKGLEGDIEGDLPKLAVGTAHVWSPQWLQISKTVRIAKKRTFNASSTPAVGAAIKARELAPIDLERIRKDMAATIERAKQEDPRELRRQVLELQRQLAARPIAKTSPAKIIERSIMKPADLTRLEKLIERAERMADRLYGHGHTLGTTLSDLKTVLRAATRVPPAPPEPQRYADSRSDALTKPVAPRLAPRQEPRGNGRDPGLNAAERKFLTVLAHRVGKPTARNQLAVLAGYSSKSGHVDNTIGFPALEGPRRRWS